MRHVPQTLHVVWVFFVNSEVPSKRGFRVAGFATTRRGGEAPLYSVRLSGFRERGLGKKRPRLFEPLTAGVVAPEPNARVHVVGTHGVRFVVKRGRFLVIPQFGRSVSQPA